MTLTLSEYRMPEGLLLATKRRSLNIIENQLKLAGADGSFLVCAKEQISFRAPYKFQFSRFHNGQLEVKVKPGDNSTSWAWIITPPDAESGRRIAAVWDGAEVSDALFGEVIPSAPTLKIKKREVPAEPAPAPAPPVQPPAPVAALMNGRASILERYDNLKQQASSYTQRFEQTQQLRDELQLLYEQIEHKEAEIKRLEIEATKDQSGKEAFERLQQIEQLLKL